MNAENAIEVRDITKKFKVYYDKGNELKERILFWKRNRYEERMVLKGISFDVRKGEAIGLIGHNGCGKSTTLKMLSKILYPDSGTIEMSGRVSSLIELGAGFHPDMSGRENIYTNAAIFGLSKREIDARLDDIIAFSELEDFIDNPVRTYSSGMYMRLAFSVAINVDADILLIDEILAVGDANFQAKCFDRLREIKAAGTTIVIVSHSLGQIEQICERSIWIHEGVIRAQGSPRDVHPEYLDYMGEERERIAAKEAERKRRIEMLKNKGKEQPETVTSANPDSGSQKFQEEGRYGKREVEVVSVSLYNDEGKERNSFRTGEAIDIVVRYRKNQEVDSVVFGFGIFKNDGTHCYGTNTMLERIGNLKLQEEGELTIRIPYNPLLGGTYDLQVGFHSDHGFYYDYIKVAKTFQSISYYGDIGVSRMNHTWVLDGVSYTVDDIRAAEEKDKKIVPMTEEEIAEKKRLSKDGFFTDHGFYQPDIASNEANQWMRQTEASIYIRNKKMDLQLMMSGGCPEGGQTLSIRYRGEELYANEDCGSKELKIVIPKEQLGEDEWIDLQITSNKLWNRSGITNGEDTRDVGPYLRDVRWTYSMYQELNKEELKVLIKPAVDSIPRDIEAPAYLQVENQSGQGQILSSDGAYPVMLGYQILDADGHIYLEEGQRSMLTDTLCPGDSETIPLYYDLSMLDPDKDYWMMVTLIQENAFWFHEADPENSVEIFLPKKEE